MTRISGATVALVDNSTSGNRPRTFTSQVAEYDHEADTRVLGVDGHVSTGRHPWTILWHGENIATLANFTDVKILLSDGTVLVDGQKTSFYEAPRDVGNGVQFQVLEPEHA